MRCLRAGFVSISEPRLLLLVAGRPMAKSDVDLLLFVLSDRHGLTVEQRDPLTDRLTGF